MQRQDPSQAVGRGLRRWQATISSWAGLARPARGAPQADAEAVREAMRRLHGELGPAGSARLAYAIDASRDVTALWHLRTPLMQALARACGERGARERIASLDPMFLQAWPKAPVTRA